MGASRIMLMRQLQINYFVLPGYFREFMKPR